MMEIAAKGFFTATSLIVAIGSQNAYVLKQGLLKRHIGLICMLCFFCDAVLMTLGIFGVGRIFAQSPELTRLITLAGAGFLFVYGALSFRAAWQGEQSLETETNDGVAKTLTSSILATLAVTLLNPHVYLDTVVIVGSLAVTLDHVEKWLFITGALLGSFLWFFGLGYGARLLRPLFATPFTWRILNTFIGIVMWGIALSLLAFAYNR
ncbi:LysE/ArgO family amino acid transporter [Phytohalomonas tamaricis]|uniref:LysE/ArgO family amino acid transporter n=1 Tax=Phytohalomonas tamaricis TaxID=2081032 RepID=UPI0021D4120E|nr:LysE/ArgO family amino acid transporter [Phytohalomonas tamaricis]